MARNFIIRFAILTGAISGFITILIITIIQPSLLEYRGTASEILDQIPLVFLLLTAILALSFILYLFLKKNQDLVGIELTKKTRENSEQTVARKKMDQELKEAKELAEARNDAKSRYLAGISHELRTPLQSILGYAQLLSKDPDIPEERKEWVSVIRRSAEHLADLIEGLLDLSRIEAGKLEVRQSQINLTELLEQIVNIFRQQASQKSIKFVYEASSNLPQYVIADEKCLRQILLNVISNAIKFTQQGEVAFRIEYRNQVARFTVADTGVGIREEDLERIFMPFERIIDQNSEKVPGTGLGLSIVKLLTDILGGEVTVESIPRQGTTFKISLMLSPSHSPSLIPSPIERVVGYKGIQKTVMIVDDEPSHRKLMVDLLTPLRFRVIEVPDASACLKQLESHTADTYLIDVSMPTINGFDLAKKLRALKIKQPIIMVSANARETPSKEDVDVPFDAYLVKPINIENLYEHLGKLLKIEWVYEKTTDDSKSILVDKNLKTSTRIDHPLFERLKAYAAIGYATGVSNTISEIENIDNLDEKFLKNLKRLAIGQSHPDIVRMLENKDQ